MAVPWLNRAFLKRCGSKCGALRRRFGMGGQRCRRLQEDARSVGSTGHASSTVGHLHCIGSRDQQVSEVTLAQRCEFAAALNVIARSFAK
eukprot:3528524-Pleurochrysis_carterae.AAC.2